jgi:hypothetical protein
MDGVFAPASIPAAESRLKPISTHSEQAETLWESSLVAISFRHHDGLALNLALYSGDVHFEELKAQADFLANNPRLLRLDCVSIIEQDADFSPVSLEAIDQLFSHYRILFAPLSMQLFRRSAWLCRNERARPYMNYWLGDRDTRSAVASDVRSFEDEVDAGAWLALTEAEIDRLRRRDGFRELAAFPAPAARAAS